MAKKYRVGIDVGGTFTDAAVIDGDTFEVVAKKKIPTTHTEGVAVGIIRIIGAVLEEAKQECEAMKQQARTYLDEAAQLIIERVVSR